eukprot:6128594-Pyramimonas_sp.AAC.1
MNGFSSGAAIIPVPEPDVDRLPQDGLSHASTSVPEPAEDRLHMDGGSPAAAISFPEPVVDAPMDGFS